MELYFNSYFKSYQGKKTIKSWCALTLMACILRFTMTDDQSYTSKGEIFYDIIAIQNSKNITFLYNH